MSDRATPIAVDLDALRGFLNVGFHRFLRMELIEADAEKGTLRIRLPFNEAYVRLTEVGDYHGGIIGALLDVAGTFLASLTAGTPTPTMNLRTDYLRSPKHCDLVATARIVRAGRAAIVADVEAADDAGTLYAVARGTWSVPSSAAPVNARSAKRTGI